MTFWEFAFIFWAGLVCGAGTLIFWTVVMTMMIAGKKADDLTSKAFYKQSKIDVTSEFKDLYGENKR